MKNFYFLQSAFLVMSMLFSSLGQPNPAQTAVYNVACSTSALITAIEAANATPADDTIYLTVGCHYLLSAVNNNTSGANGLPVIADAATAGKLTIKGSAPVIVPKMFFWLPEINMGGSAAPRAVNVAGATIERDSTAGTPDFRLFRVASGGNLTLDSVTLQNGNLPTQYGGGIFNAGTLNVTNSTFTGNTANFGGGIFSLGSLTVSSSAFSANSASLGDGIFVAEGTSTITSTSFSNDATFTCPLFPYTVPAGNIQELGDAIHCANSTPEDNLINLTSSIYTLTTIDNTTLGPNGLPAIEDAAAAGKLTLHGNGATITRSTANGTPDFRIFQLNSGGNLTLDSLTVKNGNLSSDAQYMVGVGGGISSLGTLMLTNTTIMGNGAVYGGGVSNNSGSLTVIDSSISSNTSIHDGAGINGNGTLVVSGSTFIGNVAQGLGGGMVSAGTATITNTTFSSNIAANTFAGGAGILMVNSSATVDGCTFFGNHTEGTGGGIFFGGTGNLAVNNSTFVNNSALYGGGAVWSGGALWVSHSTLNGNSAGHEGGGIDYTGGKITLDGSLVAGNTAPSGADLFGPVTSLGYNLIGSTSGATITGSTTGNLTDAAAAPLNLGPLQNNGGPTKTMALLAGSVAIDAGNPAFTPPPYSDQRGPGFPRVAGGRIDIGAYEK